MLAIKIEWNEKDEGLFLDEKNIFERLRELLRAEKDAQESAKKTESGR